MFLEWFAVFFYSGKKSNLSLVYNGERGSRFRFVFLRADFQSCRFSWPFLRKECRKKKFFVPQNMVIFVFLKRKVFFMGL